MEQLKIFGQKKLEGSIKVDASKNAFLPIMASTVLIDDEIFLENYVDLVDLKWMQKILEILNIKCKFDGEGLYINAKNTINNKITHDLTEKVRASIFLLGAILGRFRFASMAYPGGCNIGARPIDIFLKSFRLLGVRIVEKHGYLYCHGENLHAGEVFLDFPSVGATESLIMCACLLDGVTTIKNAAKEPEVCDLCNFLNLCGAKIYGVGGDMIVIVGVKKLHGIRYKVMSDRIVAGTYLIACAACGGDVLLEDVNASHNEILISFLRQSACQIDVENDKIRLKATQRPFSIDKIQTLPYPNFPTDLQPQMMALQSVSKGVCLLRENLFENRFAAASELVKMNADISLHGRLACIVGVEKLYGADVSASDLRAGAALVIAGLVAEGYTTISGVSQIDRGYEKIEQKYSLLGADIKRIEIE